MSEFDNKYNDIKKTDEIYDFIENSMGTLYKEIIEILEEKKKPLC